MPKGSGGRSAGSKKWIQKGSSQDLEEDEEEDPSSGPKYNRAQLLRLFGSCNLAGESGLTAKPDESLEVQDAQKPTYVLKDRPVEEGEGSKTPGARRALREQMKVEKLRRLSTDNLEEVDEAVQTPSGQKLELDKELGDATPGAPPQTPQPPQTPASNAAMWRYLQSMWTPYMNYAGGQTSVMLRNIPNRYTRDQLVERLDKGYKGQYDFVYLPIDFVSKCNVGYAFINFRNGAAATRFIQEFHNAKTKVCLPGFSSSKVAEVSYARVQGRDANMENLRDEKFVDKLGERPDWQPLFFDDQGKEIPFSKTLGDKSKKRKPATPAGMAPHPGSPTGYMMPPYYPMYPPMYQYPPSEPPTTLASVLPGAQAAAASKQQTLLMLRNVPKNVSRDKLLELLKSKFNGDFDFLFLPGNVSGEGSRGFFFINFRTFEKAEAFKQEFNQKPVKECFPEEPSDAAEGAEAKACEVETARIESVEKSIERVQVQSMQETAEQKESAKTDWHPMLIKEGGEVEAFPTLSASTAAHAARGREQASGSAGDRAKAGDPATPSDRKAKKKATPKAGGPAPGGYSPYGYGGYPGYFGYPGMPYPGMAAAAYSYQAQMAQASASQTHQQAAQQASANADLFNHVLDPLAAAVNPKERKEKNMPLSKENKEALRKQVEYYFSANNLCKDLYLRSHMGAEGWTSLDLIVQFPQVRKYKTTLPELMEVVSDSTMFEIDKEKKRLRLKDEEERTRWGRATVPAEFQAS